MALFYSSVPVSHDSVTVSPRAQQDPAAKAAKWNSATIHFIIGIRAFPYCDMPQQSITEQC